MKFELRGCLGLSTLLLFGAVADVTAQERGATRIAALVRGLTVANRVMIVGLRPDDEDPYLLGWLSRTQRVETAYLSLTRGESAPNKLGPEAGVALGIIRERELLAEHRDDDVRLFFTRAYDFGQAKDSAVAFKRWNRASVVGDIVASLRVSASRRCCSTSRRRDD